MSFLLLVNGRHFDFRHTQTSNSISTSLSMLHDPENMCIAVGSSLLSGLEADIRNFLSTSGLRRHIGYLVGAKLLVTPPSCSPVILGKSY